MTNAADTAAVNLAHAMPVQNPLCRAIRRGTDDAPLYFVQNRHGATVGGPYTDLHEAWRDVDQREPDERAKHESELRARSEIER